jgi:hypothetical protein
LNAAYWDDDWKWARDLLLRFASNPDPDIQWAVATGFGLVAYKLSSLPITASFFGLCFLLVDSVGAPFRLMTEERRVRIPAPTYSTRQELFAIEEVAFLITQLWKSRARYFAN